MIDYVKGEAVPQFIIIRVEPSYEVKTISEELVTTEVKELAADGEIDLLAIATEKEIFRYTSSGWIRLEEETEPT